MKQERAKAAKQRLRPVLEQNDPPTIGTAAGVKYDKPNRAPFIFFFSVFMVPLPHPDLGLVQSRHRTVFGLSLVHTFLMLCILVQYYVYPTKRIRQSQPGWARPWSLMSLESGV